MMQFKITGMTCAACQTRVEKAVAKVPGVRSCQVNLLTNSMSVEGEASQGEIISAVEKAGYGAFTQADEKNAVRESTNGRQMKAVRNRLLASAAFLAVLMYVSMGHGMFGFPLPSFIGADPVALGLTQLLLCVPVLFLNRSFFISGIKSVLHAAPNMDTLVSLGSAASFLRSVYAVFSISHQITVKGISPAVISIDGYWFESSAMILVLITVGKLLEEKSKGKTTDALQSLKKLAAKTASVLRDGEEMLIPIEQLSIGDTFLVRPGESFPADGTVIDGETAVNESMLTGESKPVDKAKGSRVYTGTVNQSGFVQCEATGVGEDTALAQIIRAVSDSAASKAPIAKSADKVAGVFVPAVIGIAAVTFAVWMLMGRAWDFALARAVSVLVISCPCALGLATPVAVMVASGVGARRGILYKSAACLEHTGKVDIVAVDKTGTVTTGESVVSYVLPADGVTQQQLLCCAASLEIKSEHPLAKAVVQQAARCGIHPFALTAFRAHHGKGIEGEAQQMRYYAGNLAFIRDKCPVDGRVVQQVNDLSEEGCTPILFAENGTLLGLIAVSDTVRADSPQAVALLKAMGIQVVMLTGDTPQTAETIAGTAHIDLVAAGLLPEEKQQLIQRLQKHGTVAMVGDGINDAPALTAADIGIAIGAGTDIAMDAADVVLMNSRLTDVPCAIRLSRSTLLNIRENLFWAFFYNVLCISLAAGCYTALLGWELNPTVGAAAMSLSSLCVVFNALRLNLWKPRSAEKTKKKTLSKGKILQAVLAQEIKRIQEEKTVMTKEMKIEGMMCPHCEARVKNALEELNGVESAEVSHADGGAVVFLTKSIADEKLKSTVEAQGYKVLSVR